MALNSIPPWLTVNPGNFVDASRAGSSVGLQIAEAQNRADREGVDAAIRMNQIAQREREAAEERAFRQWELQQKIHQDALQMAETARYHDLSIKEAMAGHAAQAAHYQAMAQAAKARGGRDNMPTEWQRDPKKSYVTPNGAVINPERPLPTEYKTVNVDQEWAPAKAGIPAQAAQKRWGPFGWFGQDKPAVPAVPPVPERPKQTTVYRIPVTPEELRQVGGPSAAPAPLAKPEGRPFTDKSGKKWRYFGNAPDPKLDRNSANWAEE